MAATLVFLTVLVIAGDYVVQRNRSAMLVQMDARLAEEIELFQDIYAREGADALVEAIAQFAPAPIAGSYLVGLFAADGELRAGDRRITADARKWTTPHEARSSADGALYLRATPIGPEGDVLVVGHSLENVHASTRGLVRDLTLAGLVVTAATALLGYAIGRATSRRLDAMADGLKAVSDGNVSARLPVGSGQDQIGRVATLMNTHLDRLERVIATTRATASAMAHELRGPLNRAYIALQSAERDGVSTTDFRSYLATASTELLTVDRMFDTILRIARLETGRNDAARDAVDLVTLVSDIAETYEPVLQDAGLNLLFETTSETARVSADADMIRRMIANLLENAARHASTGSRVTLSVGRREDVVELCVADDGPGIPEADRVDAIRPFQQIGPARERRGVGLGLALVRTIVDHHRGSMTLADNHPGLRVEIQFPCQP